mmetsp:Transcript_15697/g.48597  ORF Transcript_15697/g.48597 Transcript_15697/m.48597 type:complete len:102 (+) Transcript_15697:146-451(+)
MLVLCSLRIWHRRRQRASFVRRYALELDNAQPTSAQLALLPELGGDRDVVAVALLRSGYRCDANGLNQARRACAGDSIGEYVRRADNAPLAGSRRSTWIFL